MLTKTTETAIMALLYLALQPEQRPRSPRHVAGSLEVSPSYLAKVFTRLAKVGILRAHRGVQGGVTLHRPAGEIRLLDIVDACQGPLTTEPVRGGRRERCDFHQAVSSFEHSVVASLSDWTLERLAAHPCPGSGAGTAVACRVARICPKHRRAGK
jgi:Rrf2 family protein